MGSESELGSGSLSVLADNETGLRLNLVVQGLMIMFDDNGIICLPFSVSSDEIDDYHNLFTTTLNESGILSSVFGNNTDDYHNLFTTKLNELRFFSFISGNKIDVYHNLFTTMLNESKFPFSIFSNKIDDYHNLFITTLNKSGFVYDDSIAVGYDSEFSDLSFLLVLAQLLLL